MVCPKQHLIRHNEHKACPDGEEEEDEPIDGWSSQATLPFPKDKQPEPEANITYRSREVSQ